MATVAKLISSDVTERGILAVIGVTLSANYGTAASHGDTLDLSQLGLPSNTVPVLVGQTETPAQGTAPTGYEYYYIPGTTQANGLLALMNGTTEFTAGNAYGGQTAAVILLIFLFPSFI